MTMPHSLHCYYSSTAVASFTALSGKTRMHLSSRRPVRMYNCTTSSRLCNIGGRPTILAPRHTPLEAWHTLTVNLHGGFGRVPKSKNPPTQLDPMARTRTLRQAVISAGMLCLLQLRPAWLVCLEIFHTLDNRTLDDLC